MQYCAYGLTHLREIRLVIKDPTLITSPPAAPEKPPRSTGKPAKEPRDTGPSARGMIFQALDEGKDQTQEAVQEKLLALLIKTFPERDPKRLKGQIYLHRSEWNKKQKEAK